MKSRTVGKRGEALAREYLKKKGYNIIDHNFRCRYGEIDLVLRKDKSFRFVEVKFRRTFEYGLPQDSVVRNKQRKIRNTALLWLRRRHLSTDCEMHFDVLAITEKAGKLKYDLIKDAF